MSGNRGRREDALYGTSRAAVGRFFNSAFKTFTPNKSTRGENYQPTERLQELVRTPQPRDISPSAQPFVEIGRAHV